MLTFFKEGFRSFHTFNIGSVGQRATKLQAVKVGGLKKDNEYLKIINKFALLAISAKMCAIMFGPGSTLPGFESFSKFESTLAV